MNNLKAFVLYELAESPFKEYINDIKAQKFAYEVESSDLDEQIENDIYARFDGIPEDDRISYLLNALKKTKSRDSDKSE